MPIIFVKIYKNIFKKPLDIIQFNDIINIDKVYAWDNCIYFSLAKVLRKGWWRHECKKL